MSRNGNFCNETWVKKIIVGTKKTAGFSLMFVMANLLCFGRFVVGWLANGWFFFAHYNIYNWRACLRLAAELPCLCLTLETVSLFQVSSRAIVLFCLYAPQSIIQYSAWNDWHRRHISNSNSYSILGRGKQLYKDFCYYKQERICRISVSVGSIIPCCRWQ